MVNTATAPTPTNINEPVNYKNMAGKIVHKSAAQQQPVLAHNSKETSSNPVMTAAGVRVEVML